MEGDLKYTHKKSLKKFQPLLKGEARFELTARDHEPRELPLLHSNPD